MCIGMVFLLMGDACHPMTPISGLAVSIALEDCFELYKQIITHGCTSKAFQEYEELHCSRGNEFVEFSNNFFLKPFLDNNQSLYMQKMKDIRNGAANIFIEKLVELTQGKEQIVA